MNWESNKGWPWWSHVVLEQWDSQEVSIRWLLLCSIAMQPPPAARGIWPTRSTHMHCT